MTAYSPFMHQKEFSELKGKLCLIVVKRNSRSLKFIGRVQAMNEHFVVLRNREGRLKLFNFNAISELIELDEGIKIKSSPHITLTEFRSDQLKDGIDG